MAGGLIRDVRRREVGNNSCSPDRRGTPNLSELHRPDLVSLRGQLLTFSVRVVTLPPRSAAPDPDGALAERPVRRGVEGVEQHAASSSSSCSRPILALIARS